MHLEFIINIMDLLIFNVFYKAFLRTESKLRRGAFFIVITFTAILLLPAKGRNGIPNDIFCDVLIIITAFLIYKGANNTKLLAAFLYAAICFTVKVWELCLPDAFRMIIPEAVKILILLMLLNARYDIRSFQGKEYTVISGYLVSLTAGSIAFILIADTSPKTAAAALKLSAAAVLTAILFCSIYAIKIIGRLIEEQNRYKNSLLDCAYKEKYYSLLKKNQLRLEKIRHSYKKQLQGILERAKEAPAEGIKMLEELMGYVDSGTEHLYTPNYVLNGICREKFSAAEECNTAIKYELHIPEMLGINAADMVCVYGNIFDKALKACKSAEPERRKIDLYTAYKDGRLYIRLLYPYNKESGLRTESGKQHCDPCLAAAEETVKRYEGIMNIEIQEKNAVIKIVLYCNNRLRAACRRL